MTIYCDLQKIKKNQLYTSKSNQKLYLILNYVRSRFYFNNKIKKKLYIFNHVYILSKTYVKFG